MRVMGFARLTQRTSKPVLGISGIEVSIGEAGVDLEIRVRILLDERSFLSLAARESELLDTDGEHSLFLPIAVEFRHDKTVADTFEEIQDQFKNAIAIAG
jgi:hypothetical protein